ncbi:MAG: SIR2 family protein [Ilumatobacteraceae bacterium]
MQSSNPDQADTTRQLVGRFLSRNDLTVASKKALDALLLKLPVGSGDEAGRQRQRSLSDLDLDTVDMLRRLIPHIKNNHFTPMLGRGMTNSLLGPLRRLAPEWARDYGSPTQLRRSTDLPVAAQFVEVMNNVDTLRAALLHDLRERITSGNGADDDGTPEHLNRLLTEAWRERCAADEHDAHRVLASLGCRIYITAHPWGLMEAALRDTGREPEVEICRWRPDVYDWPETVFEREPDYEPTRERPLVFHVFGSVETPESLLLSADDYLDFLISVTADRSLIPMPVASALADSALQFLGFGLEDAVGARMLL